MRNTEILINGTSVDLYKEEPIKLVYSIADVKDIGNRNSTHSYTIKLPATAINNNLLNHIYEITSDHTFNPNLKSPAYIITNSIQVVNGNFQLVSINKDLSNEIYEYEGVIYGLNNSLKDSLGERTLNQLNFSGETHSRTQAVVEGSWLNTSGYTYPIINNGFGWSYPEIASGGTRPINISEMFPTPFVKTIIDRIFSDANFTYSSRFFDSDYFKKLVLYYPVRENIHHIADIRARIDIQYDNTLGNRMTGYARIKKKTPSIGWTTLKTQIVDAMPNTIATWNIDLKTTPFLDENDQIMVELDMNCVTALPITIYATNLVTDGGFSVNYRDNDVHGDSFAGNLGTDSTILNVGNNYLALKFPEVTTSPYHNIYGTYSTASNKHYVPALQFKYFLPEGVKQVDFFLWITKMFNLFIDVDPEIPNKLIIEPRDQFFNPSSGASTKDWTSKLDLSKEFDIKLLSELQNKTIDFTYKEDSDYLNGRYKTDTSLVYGSNHIELTNDFITSKKKIEIGFSPSPLHYIEGSSELLVPSIYSKNEDDIEHEGEFNPRILYYGGLVNLPTETLKIDYSGFTGNYTYYPYAGELDHPYNPTLSLMFDTPDYVFYDHISTSGYPQTNLYTTYYEKYIQEISHKNSKLVTCYLNLSASDIAQFRFTDIIFLKDAYYSVNKIEYDALDDKTSKVELLKFEKFSPVPKFFDKSPKRKTSPNKSTSIGSYNQNSYLSSILGEYNTIEKTSRYNTIIGQQNIINDNSNLSYIFGNNNTIESNTNQIALLNTSGTTVLSGSNITVIGLNNFSGASQSNTVYIGETIFMSGVTINGELVNQYWTAGTGTNALIRYPIQPGIECSGSHSIITSGKFNTARTAYSSVLNGKNNFTSNLFSTIINGQNNTTTGYNSLIGAGSGNYNSNQSGTILNGDNNFQSGAKSTILNGNFNRNYNSDMSLIGSGKFNSAITADYSVILGGSYHYIQGINNTIINGENNNIVGRNSVIIGGKNNNNSAGYSFIFGNDNYIKSNISAAKVKSNFIFGASNSIFNQEIINSDTLNYNSIINGKLNVINKNIFLGERKYNTIINGKENGITNGYYSSVINGKNNIIISDNCSSILVGRDNLLSSTTNSSIISGERIIGTTNNTAFGDKLQLISLSGSGYNYVVADSNGLLSLSSITSGGGTTSTNSNGLNTYTGGTALFQSINISGGTFNNITVTGNSSFNVLSATTFYSGSTPLSQLFLLNSNNVWYKANNAGSIGITGWSQSIGSTLVNSFNASFGGTASPSGDYGYLIGGTSQTNKSNSGGIIGGYKNTVESTTYQSIWNSVQCTANGKDPLNIILNSQFSEISNDSGFDAIINCNSSTINQTGTSRSYITLIGLFEHHETQQTGITVVNNIRHKAGVYSKNKKVSANYLASTDDYLITVDTSSLSITINLPATTFDGHQLIIKDYQGSASTNNITVNRNGGYAIDGSSSHVISTNFGSVWLIYTADVGEWSVISNR